MIYVDNFRAPARIRKINGRWSHLTADSADELIPFAVELGLSLEWFQSRCKHGACPAVPARTSLVCAHFHFDVTDSVRQRAIAQGARAIDIREMGALTSARRDEFRVLAAAVGAGGL